MRMIIILLAGVAATFLGASRPEARTIQLSATAIRIEINDTDGDAGIQIFLDGVGWDRMKVFDPDGNQVLDFEAEGSVGIQGITELFFESAEPSFDEQPLAELLALFPEGFYRFEGTSTDGDRLKGKARLTHALPAGPLLVSPVEDDDEVDPDNTVIEWQPVPDPAGSTIVGYQVLVVRENPSLRVFSADVGSGTTSVSVPPEFLEPGTVYKYEVLAIEASGNQTISEREFETAD
jgi:hypothetical protein